MKKSILQVCGLFVVICGFAAPSCVAAQNDSIIARADRYVAALEEYEKGTERKSVEFVFRKGQSVAKKLDELENLNEADYASVTKKMKGFIVNRDETIYIEPEVDFFKKLSKKFGTKSDAAFFTFWSALKPDSVWSAYIEQQTDYSGCALYGKGILTELHGKAEQFRRQYPRAYTTELKEEIDEMKRELTSGTCACGNRNSVTEEFRLFIKTFPADEITPTIKRRLKGVQNKKTAIRFNCISG